MLITGVRVQVPPRAPRRSKVRFAPTSFYATGKKDVIRPLPCSSFPTATRCAGLAVGGPPCGRHFRSEGNIDFNRPFHKKRTSAKQLSFSCGFRRPFGRLHPSVIEMLGGSTRKGYATSVRRQSRQRLCGEFRLRQDFRLRQNARTAQMRRQPEGRLGGSPIPFRDFMWSQRPLCGHVFLYLWQKRSHPPDPCTPSPTATRPEGGFYDREAIDFDRFSNSPQAFRAFGGFL